MAATPGTRPEAGIVAFLLELHAFSGEDRLPTRAVEAGDEIARFLDSGPDLALDVAGGAAGVLPVLLAADGNAVLDDVPPLATAVAERRLLELADLIGEPRYLDDLESLIDGLEALGAPEERADRLWHNHGQCRGDAGIGDFALLAHACTEEARYLDLARRCADVILAASEVDGGRRRWRFAEHRTIPDLVERAAGVGAAGGPAASRSARVGGEGAAGGGIRARPAASSRRPMPRDAREDPLSPHSPRALRAEGRIDPIGLGPLPPRLSWQLDDERPGARQSAYRVLVARDPAALDREAADLWDSGRVESDAHAHVVYRGAPLGSRARAYWRVQSFDAAGEASPWSATASLEVGLLERSDWQATWIATPLRGGPRTSPPVPALRREFHLDAAVRRARVYVTALGLYELWLNGARVGDHELAPGWTDYHRRVRYQAFDATPHLRPGANAIGALLGDGWYCGWIGLRNLRERWGERPALLLQLEIEHEDGRTQRVVSDGAWCWHASEILAADLLQGETVDARRALGAWTEPAFDAAGWRPVECQADPGIALDAMSGPPVRIVRELAPVAPPARREASGPGAAWLYDFGQNLVGRVRLRVRGERGATLRLRHGEALDDRGELYVANLREAAATDVFTLAGEPGGETFEPRFTFHGFRYLEVAGPIGAAAIEAVTAVVLSSDLAETGTFTCSDPDLERLESNIVWAQRGNFLDVPTDCPQRDERLGWTGDAQVFVRTAAFHMDVSGFFAKWLLDLEDAQGPDGRIPPVAPLPTALTRGLDGGPAWADAVVICPWTIWRCYGDLRIVEERLGSMVRYLDFLIERFPDGIRSHPDRDGWGGFGDWCALDGSVRSDDRIGATPKDLIGTAFLAHSARLVSDMAAAIDRPDEARRFDELALRVREAFRRRFVTAEGLVTGNTQTSYLLPLQFDLLEPGERDACGRALARHVEAHGHLTTGFVGTPYLLPVLTAIGRLDLAYHLLLRREFPSWLYPVVHGGATTIWERWDGWTRARGFSDPAMNSLNHYAYGSVGEWLYATVAGLDLHPAPEASGWRRARIAPRPPVHPGLPDPPLLDRASATLDTVHGRWAVAWRLDRARLRVQVRVPAGCRAELDLPDGTCRDLAAGEHEIECSCATRSP